MTEEFLIEIMRLSMHTIALLSAPPLAAIIIVGLLSNILQTVTQLKDQALSFVPKMVVSGLVMILLIPWYVQILRGFSEVIFSYIERGAM